MSYPTEDFDSYSNGAINGLNGGTGWSAGWVDADNVFSVQSGIFLSTPRAAKGTGDGANHLLYRMFPTYSTDDEILTFYIYIDGNTSGSWDIALYQSGNTDVAAGIQFRSSDSSIRFISTGGATPPWTVIQSYSPNQWYKLDLKLNFTAQTYQYQVDNGGFSSSFAFWTSSTDIDTFQVRSETAGSGNDVYVDNIGIVFPVQTDETFTTDAVVTDNKPHFDSASSYNAGGSTSTTHTWSHTVGFFSDRVLVVSFETASTAITGITFNGVALTQIQSASHGGSTEQWYLLEPDIGTHNIVVSLAASVAGLGSGISAYGIRQTGSINVQNTFTATINGNGAAAGILYTTTEDNTLTIGAASSDASVNSITSPDTTVTTNVAFNPPGDLAGYYKSLPLAGLSSDNFNFFGANGNHDIMILAAAFNAVLFSFSETFTTDAFVNNFYQFTTDAIVKAQVDLEFTTDCFVFTEEFAPCEVTSSNYKWMTDTLLTAQQKFNVRPYFVAKILDDDVVPNQDFGNFNTSLVRGAKGSMVTAPDGAILSVGEIMDNSGATTGTVGFWKVTDGSILTQWQTPTTVLDVTSSLPTFGANIGDYSIQVSEYINGTYRIDVYYFVNFGGTFLNIKHFYSDDGGTTWTGEEIITDIPGSLTYGPFGTNIFVAAGKPFRKTDGTITSTCFFLRRTNYTDGNYVITYALSETGSGPFTQTDWSTESIDSQDWILHSLDTTYKNGVHTIVFSGYHLRKETVNTTANDFLGNLSLYLTALRDTNQNSWDFPYEIITSLASSETNQNAFYNPKLEYDRDRKVLYLTFAGVIVDSVLSSAQNSAILSRLHRYMFTYSKDFQNFRYPTFITFTDGTPFPSADFVDIQTGDATGLMQESYVPQGEFFYLGAGTRGGFLWQFIENDIVADITFDTLQYAVKEAGGQPSNITLQIGNQDGKWFGPTPTEPGNAAIAKDKKILLFQGYYNADNEPETIPKNVYYIDDIRQNVTYNRNDLILTARDWFKKLKTTITKYAFNYVGPKFYYDSFDGTTFGNWTQKTGTWVEQSNTLVATAPLVNDIVNPNTDSNTLGGTILLNNSISLTDAFEMAVTFELPDPSLNNHTVYVYFYWEDSDNWIRLRITSSTFTGAHHIIFIEHNIGGVGGAAFVDAGVNFQWSNTNKIYAAHIRKYHNNIFNFTIGSNQTVTGEGGNNQFTWDPSGAPFPPTNLGPGWETNLDLSPFVGFFTGLGSVGLGYDNFNPNFMFFKFLQYGNSNSIQNLLQALGTKASIFEYKPQQVLDDHFFNPVPYTGTYTVPNRVLTITKNHDVFRNTIEIDNGEIEFFGQVRVDESTTEYGFRVYFRAQGDADNAYVWELKQQAEGVISRFFIAISGTEYLLYENTPVDYGATNNSIPVDLTLLHTYKLVFADSFMYAFIDGQMIAAWSDTNTTQTYDTGQFGFALVTDGGDGDNLRIKHVSSGFFWHQIPTVSLNPGDDIEQSVDGLVQTVRGWNFSDLFARFKTIMLQTTDPSTYTYNEQLYSQNLDNSDKEYVNQVTVYGSGVSATTRDEESIGQSGKIRELVIVDYKISTFPDAQDRADFELVNAKKHNLQSRPKQTNNVGAEVFDVVTVVNLGANSADTDFAVRVYDQSVTSSGTSEYSVELDTGQL